MNKLYPFYTLPILLCLLAIAPVTSSALKYAKHGCKDKCGNVKIPYPFGIGANCSINEWYTVDCNSSTPYLRALNQLQVLGVNLENQRVMVNMPMISDCSQTKSIDLGRSPFLFSKSQNKFVYKGCGNAVMMDHGSRLTGCSTTCGNDSVSDTNDCLGISCCQTTIPHYIKSYNTHLKGCGSAFLVDKDSYSYHGQENSYVPVSLLWTLSDTDIKKANCCYKSSRVEVDTGNGTLIYSWKCVYEVDYTKVEGNAYVNDGCRFVENGCDKCQNGGGYCNLIYEVDDDMITDNQIICEKISDFTISRESKSSLGVILGVSISMGVLFAMATSYVFYRMIKKIRETRRRKRFFKRNGGLLLKQQEEADASSVNKTILFTSRELEKATDNFNENRILGRGGQGMVYKGMLADGRIVAIKKSKVFDETQLAQFVNEVVVLSQVNHRNVVKLLGCCLETDVPLLVSEFIPNGTLYDILHDEAGEFPDSLNMRLQIAIDVARAVAYLHSSTSIPIYHRDIKTTNILLDDKYRAKVSDFGTSRFISIDQTHLTTLVKGTFGYLDPEYFQSNQFTEKSDVYSFGVVLVELLTGERPISVTRFGENKSLAEHFTLAMEEGRVMSIFDAMVIKEGETDKLLALANLAMRCLNVNGKYRPNMKEVAAELETIHASHDTSKDETSMRHVYEEDFSMLRYGESSSTFVSFNDSVSQ